MAKAAKQQPEKFEIKGRLYILGSITRAVMRESTEYAIVPVRGVRNVKKWCARFRIYMDSLKIQQFAES